MRSEIIRATKVGGNFYTRDVPPLRAPRLSGALGQPLADLAPDVVLPMTHDANFSPAYLRFAVEQSLRRLQTDYIDLLQLHNPALNLIAAPETYHALDDLKAPGKIGFSGGAAPRPADAP